MLYLSDEYSRTTMPSCQILHPELRKVREGVLIWYAHNLYYKQFLNKFRKRVTTEIRGVYEGDCSVFWKNFLEHYLGNLTYKEYLNLIEQGFEDQICEQLPKGPIPIPTISKEAAAVIGGVNLESKGSLKIGEADGFESKRHIAYSTAAPCLESNLKDIRSVQKAIIATNDKMPQVMNGSLIISNAYPNLKFRACIGEVQNNKLLAETSKKLGIEKNESICFLQ